ncbi:MAG: hypothetical protein WDN26_19195 [Chitinophagaceae bacterium]
MFKQGATLNESIAAISAIASDKASSTHPGKADRVAAITRGWNNAKAELPANNNTGGNAGGNTSGGNTGGNTGGNSPAEIQMETLVRIQETCHQPMTPSWINLSMQSTKTETVQLSDDGKTYQPAEIKAGEPFVFLFEIYQYGWLKLPYFNGFRTYKLMHGKDYHIPLEQAFKKLDGGGSAELGVIFLLRQNDIASCSFSWHRLLCHSLVRSVFMASMFSLLLVLFERTGYYFPSRVSSSHVCWPWTPAFLISRRVHPSHIPAL